MENVTNMQNWNVADENGIIDVPDELDPMINMVGTQLRFHTISKKAEGQTVADIVYKAQQFFHPKWISVKDKLPPSDIGDQYYLIMTTTCGIDMQECMHYTDTNGNPFMTWNDYENDQVTHWMNLPKEP